MDQGQIVETGAPKAVLSDPKEARTRAFIGAVRHWPAGALTGTSREEPAMATDFPRRIANLADPAPEFPWPNGKTCAVFPAFDVDAETAWLQYDARNTDRLVTLSFGHGDEYSAEPTSCGMAANSAG